MDIWTQRWHGCKHNSLFDKNTVRESLHLFMKYEPSLSWASPSHFPTSSPTPGIWETWEEMAFWGRNMGKNSLGLHSLYKHFNRFGPFRTVSDHFGPFRTISPNIGPFRPILDHFGPIFVEYWTISRIFANIGPIFGNLDSHTNKFVRLES